MANCNTKKHASHFKPISTEKKKTIFEETKVKNTERATDQWVSLFKEYLKENKHCEIDDIHTKDIGAILCDFYPACKKVKKSKPKLNPDFPNANFDEEEEEEDYHNSTMKCIKAALNRYFRQKRGVDITSGYQFIEANEMFKALQKKGKNEGCGEIENKKAISEEDYKKLREYFKRKMHENSTPKKLQEVVLFNIIYYMGRRGLENLRYMTKETFKIARDPDGRRYIYQAIKESD